MRPQVSNTRRAWWLLVAIVGVSSMLPDLLQGQGAAGGLGHSVFLKSDGTVWTVGANASGQIGDNTTTTKKTPVQVSGLSDVTAVAAGASHSMAITSTGTLYVWGENGTGQVGDNSTTDRKTPVASNLTNVVGIAAGASHSVAVKSNGDVYVWGRDNKGQLGDGTAGSTNTLVPTLLTTGAAAVAAGPEFTLVVKTDGTVYGAGENSDYQLGDGTTTDRSSLVQMSGASGVVAASAGEKFSIVLLSTGVLKGVGYNNYGQLGDGSTTTPRTSLVSVASVSNITAIASGADHTIARESDGTVWTWGRNLTSQIGSDSVTTHTATPVELTSLPSITKIGAGDGHSLAISSTGVVYAWGNNSSYQLGDGTTEERVVPTAISDAGFDWKVSTPTFSVAGGTYSVDKVVAIAITTSGATIRYTQNGSEPTESDSSIASGSSVSVTSSQTLKAKAFKSGMPASSTKSAAYELKVATPTTSPAGGTYTSAQNVTMATTTSGATLRYTIDGTTPTGSSPVYSSAVHVPTTTTMQVLGFKSGWTESALRTSTFNMNFGTLATPTADQAGGPYVNQVTVALSSISGATIRYTANNTAVQSTSPLYSAPLAFDVTTTLRFRAYHPDFNQSAEVIHTYTLAAAAPTFNPTAGTYVGGQTVTVSAASTGSIIRYTLNGAEPSTSDPTITSGSTLVVGNYTLKAKAWKTGANASTTTTAAYALSSDVAPPALLAGESHALAIRNDGTTWAWGAGSGGRLGDGTSTSRLLPTIVSGVTGAVALSAGADFSHVLTTGGSLMGFGGNSNGRLGDGTTTASSVPTPASATAIVAIEAGQDHVVALKGDGTLVAWGTNSVGQIGNGTTAASQLSPASVSSLTSVAAIAAGRDFSLAVKQNGTAWAWGENSTGQLGIDSTTDQSSPVQVDDITTATKVAAGTLHALALLSDGTVVSWGRNLNGELGDSTTIERHTPVPVSLLTDIVAIAAGSAFSLALDDEGRVFSWGSNSHGQLGLGTTTDGATPVQIPTLSNIVQITAGDDFALALDDESRVFAWGANFDGQLGNGQTSSELSPIEIAGPGMSWRVATPTLSLASGLYYATQAVTVTISDPNATLRYTTTGVDPTSSDATVTSGGSIPVDASQMLKVSGWKTGWPTSVVVARTYQLKAVTPTMSPSAGAYGGTQSVAISSTTTGATLRYTTDGTEPTSSSPAYTSAITVPDTMTVKARAYKTGWTESDSGYASYSISGGTVATPVISPAGGAHSTPPLVAMTTATSGATIRYTLDGSTPIGSSAIFVYPLLVPATTTVKAKAFKAGHSASGVATTTYDVDLAGATATPVIVPAGGAFATAQTVTITGASGAALRYTTDGTDPTTSSTSITSGATVVVSKSQVLKVRAWASGVGPSAVRRADFMITGASDGGGTHSMALTSEGAVYTWGTGGVIGDGNTTAELTPKEVATGGVAISMGGTHALVAKSDGTVWGWGTATNGRLGNGSSSGVSYSPAQASGVTAAVDVAAGLSHSLVLKNDGTVWAFGRNDDGQLGDGSTTDRNTAVQVIGLDGIVGIAAGRASSYALQSDGAGGGIVWAWGANAYGELGDGSQFLRATPVKVVGLPVGISRLSAVDHGAIALGTDGKVYAWGRNEDGQAGSGHSAIQATAQPVSVLDSIRAIGSGASHVLAIDATARSWAWGLLGSHLGLGASFSANSWVPERSDLVDALQVSGGNAHTLAVMPDGTLSAFGSNQGQLGNGTTSSSVVPVVVSGLSLADNAWLTGDADADGLATWREYYLGTDPLNADSNGNGVLDGVDVGSGLSATNPDIDGDGVPNWLELQHGTDPFRADTDGDTVPDGSDAYPLDPTRSLPPSTNPSDTTPPIVTLKAPVSARLLP